MAAKELAMKHPEFDRSLCTGERTLESLDDGFSPPPSPQAADDDAPQAVDADAESVLSTKSPF